MADPVSMSLDDYIKTQKKTGKMSYGRGGGGGRRGPKAGPSNGGRNRNTVTYNSGGAAGSYGKRGGQNSFRGRKGQATKNVQQQRGRGNRGYGGRNRQQQFSGPGAFRGNLQRFTGGITGGGQGQNRRLSVNKRGRNSNRPMRQQHNNVVGINRSLSRQQGITKQRYFSNAAAVGQIAGKAKRNQARRPKLNRNIGLSTQVLAQRVAINNRNTKRAVMKLAKKRVQRAKLLVSRKKASVGAGKLKKLIPMNGRVALGKNGFITVRNTNTKRMERALVQLKIARAQQARNRTSPQRNVNLPGPSPKGRRSVRPGNLNIAARSFNNLNTGSRPLDWNTPIVRTMRNEMADEMTSGQLNPDIQRKIAFIQSRSKTDRAPVMPDFKAPVTTSRMKLSDRFRLMSDH